ncbi:hypothetical protein M0R45_037347 [Rubus argutus]|uniref:Agglutinin domain-containing protein n=1 Tax=Rubus argutus TaxID=59490 RepID=A0AAW1W2M3_RUBAR
MSDLPVILPAYIVLKSVKGRYLDYVPRKEGDDNNFLEYSGKNVFSRSAKLQVVTANIGEGVHLRCCYNKKYLRLRKSPAAGVNNNWIAAVADEPEEDTGKWSCTLFEPLSVAGHPKQIRLRHVYLGNYASQWQYEFGDIKGKGLTADYSVHDQSTGCDCHTVIDWESLVVLPKHVALKGNNGHYASVQYVKFPQDSNNYLCHVQFVPIAKQDPRAWFVVSTNGDGSVKLHNHGNATSWGVDPDITGNWVRVQDMGNDTPRPCFWPVKLDKNVIALRSLGSGNKFCSLYSEDVFVNCFKACSSTITADTRLEVEELVLSRKVYNAVFHLDQTVIYGETPISMATASAVNNGSTENTVEMKLSYTQTKSSTWTMGSSVTKGVEASMSVGIPSIGLGANMSVSEQYTGSYEVGSTVTTESTIETTYTVVVPPKSSVTVSVLATKGYCDVPFSYFQRDVLYDGETVVYKKDDGLFTGVNAYNFHYMTDEPVTLSPVPSQQKQLVPAVIAFD